MSSTESSSCCCKHSGPGYSSPKDAFENGKKEKLLFVTCVQVDGKNDLLATIDVDPNSPTYSKIIQHTWMPSYGDELHHSGWNVCSSCFNDCNKKRDKLILPCLNSNRIYIVNVNDQGMTSIHHIIDGEKLLKLNVSGPHTSHCLPNGMIMISCMGDKHGNPSGSFLLIDSKTYEPIDKLWNKTSVRYGYDFWYQPRLDLMVSSEWTSPKNYRLGFNNHHKIVKNQTKTNDDDDDDGLNLENFYGKSIHLWKFSQGTLLKSINLKETTGKDALMPLEIRFLHRPDSCIGFVGCAFTSNVFRFKVDPDLEDFTEIKEIISIPSKIVENFKFGQKLPALITDILISMDDNYLYLSTWAFGEIRKYSNISNDNIENIQMISIIRIGGLLSPLYNLKVLDNPNEENFDCHYQINNQPLLGGTQMLQLSLDGKRLYVTNSLYSVWDGQFYPKMFENGSQMVKINVLTEKEEEENDGNGNETTKTTTSKIKHSFKLDENFFIDFGQEPNGPYLAHEMRYPGGDCTSDIWI